MKRHSLAAALVTAVAAGGLTLGGCTTGSDESTPDPTGETKSQGTTAEDRQTAEQEGREESGADERDDLLDFRIDDRSQAGLEDIWVTWTIKNQSSEKSNHSFSWEAVAPDGKRIYNSSEFVTDVQPGQTTTGEMPTTLKTPDVELHITDFERTKAY